MSEATESGIAGTSGPAPTSNSPGTEPPPPAQAVPIIQVLANPSLGAEKATHGAGVVVFDPHTPATAVFFIHSGQIRIHQVGPDQSARLVEILGPGDWFGVPALARVPHYNTRATVVTESALSSIPVDRLLLALAQEPILATELIGQLAAKLQHAHEHAANLVFDDTSQRLVKTLLHFSRTAAATPQEDGVVLRITHEQLAQAVGAARETVSLALTQLRQRNLLRTGRNRLFFNPDALKKFSERPIFSEGQMA